MNNKADWLLPEGVAPLLPPQAQHLDDLRRTWLEGFRLSGYQLVQTPFVDFATSLLAGAGADLSEQSFRLTDPMGGGQLAIRADITPQVARIDAHSLPTDAVARYSYAGTVLRTHPTELAGSRCPLQVGVELYGHAGIEADLEVIGLMLDALLPLNLELVLDLNHVLLFRQVAVWAGLDEQQQQRYFDLAQRKACTELTLWLQQLALPQAQAQVLLGLLELYGEASGVIQAGRALLQGIDSAIDTALAQLEQVCQCLALQYKQVSFYIDLAEIRGYGYHTGLLFAVYCQGQGRALAQGGRYDDVGKRFGRSRPATGFSADLRLIAELSTCPQPEPKAILAPVEDDPQLFQLVRRLRADNQRVVQALGCSDDYRDRCDRILVRANDSWQIEPWA